MSPISARLLVLATPILLVACKDKAGDSGQEDVGFCYKMADANTTDFQDGGGTSTSGQLAGRLITDESDDLHDPAIVTNVTYHFENIDIDGGTREGETDAEGRFTESNLQPGNWRITLSDNKAGFACHNSLEFVIEANKTTRMCMDVGCE